MAVVDRWIDWLGVDVGWVFPAADSDGNVYEWTRFAVSGVRLIKAGPVTIHRPDGTVTTRPAYTRSDTAMVLARGADVNLVTTARRIVKLARETDRGIALESFPSFSRRKSAWIKVWRKIEATASAARIEVVQVDRAYTSQTCPDCGYCSRTNRPTRNTFVCQRCGCSGHADVVAARNIAAKARGRFAVDRGTCLSGGCASAPWRAGLCGFCYRWKRRTGRCPSTEDLAARGTETDLAKYRAKMRARAERERQERRDRETSERLAESYRTHDAWGNPLSMLDGASVRT